MNRLLLLSAAAALLVAAGAEAQSAIVPGEVTRGGLQYGDPRLQDGSYFHDYVFEGRRGETVIVSMASPSFDAYLYLGLLDRGFVELGRDDDGGGGTDARLELQLPESGRYVIRASSLYEATGPYTLTLTGGRAAYDARGGYEPQRGGYDDRARYGDAREAHGGPLHAGRPVNGYLDQSAPELDGGERYHIYTYRGRRGERVTIDLRSSEFDSYLVLGTPGGRHGIQSALARDDDGGGSRNSRIVYTFQYDGEYAIRVNPLLSGIGRYTLDLASSHGY